MGRVLNKIKQNANAGKGLSLENRRWTGTGAQGMLLSAHLPTLFARPGAFVTARIFLVFVMVTALADPAWAYVDPNAGGLIFQIAMPILSLGVAAVTVLRKRIVEFFKRLAFAGTSSTQADQNAAKE